MTRAIVVKQKCRCGNGEVLYFDSGMCGECWDREEKETAEALISRGWACEDCKEGGSWFRKLFPRKSVAKVKGRYRCRKHAVAAKLAASLLLALCLIACSEKVAEPECVEDEVRRCGCDDAWTELGWQHCANEVWGECECE
jgi:hypothetical protein